MTEAAKWYVIHTYSGYENKVAQDIEKVVENRKLHDLILEVKVPTENIPRLCFAENDLYRRLLAHREKHSWCDGLCRTCV